MIPFNKKKDHAPGASRGKAAMGIARILHLAQSKWAKWMARRTARLSKQSWKAILAFMVLTIGSYCGYLVYCGLNESAATFMVERIKRPALITIKPSNTDSIILEKQHHRIRRFKHYLDSLARSPGGAATLDSILARRPGLIDSLKQADTLYQSLLKKQQ